MSKYFQAKGEESSSDEEEDDIEVGGGTEHKDNESPPGILCMPLWARQFIWNRFRLLYKAQKKKRRNGDSEVEDKEQVRQQRRMEAKVEMKRQEDVISGVVRQKREAEQFVSEIEAKMRDIIIEAGGVIPDVYRDVMHRQAQDIQRAHAKIKAYQTEIEKRENGLSEYRTRELEYSLEYDRLQLDRLFSAAGYKQKKEKVEENKTKKDEYDVPEYKEQEQEIVDVHVGIISRLQREALEITQHNLKKTTYQSEQDQLQELTLQAQLKAAREAELSAPPPLLPSTIPVRPSAPPMPLTDICQD
jgi:hypothetical protein